MKPTKPAACTRPAAGAGSTNRPPKWQKRAYKKGEWSDLELTAKGGDITVKINGVVSTKLTNDKSRKEGHIGLQLHGSQVMHVEYKDIQLKPL